MCEQNDVGAQKFKTNLVGRPNWWMFCLLAVLAVGIGGCAELSTNPALRPTIVSSASARTTPQLAVSPESVYAGSDIQVVGSNWPANSLVLVTLTDGENQSGILSATNADSDGDLATAFVYPSGETGSAMARTLWLPTSATALSRRPLRSSSIQRQAPRPRTHRSRHRHWQSQRRRFQPSPPQARRR
ncbi:MAG: hypothetical protein R2856_12850 [Caldilineaceae bacterium]